MTAKKIDPDKVKFPAYCEGVTEKYFYKLIAPNISMDIEFFLVGTSIRTTSYDVGIKTSAFDFYCSRYYKKITKKEFDQKLEEAIIKIREEAK